MKLFQYLAIALLIAALCTSLYGLWQHRGISPQQACIESGGVWRDVPPGCVGGDK